MATSPIHQKKADELGMRYASIKDTVSTTNEQLDEVKDEIKKLAVFGEREGKQAIITGKQFVVGTITSDPQIELNYKQLFKEHPHLKLILRSTVVDEKKVVAAIDSGMISRKMLKRYTVPSKRKATVSVYVRAIDDKQRKKRL